jgi:hypothetical protein
MEDQIKPVTRDNREIEKGLTVEKVFKSLGRTSPRLREVMLFLIDVSAFLIGSAWIIKHTYETLIGT